MKTAIIVTTYNRPHYLRQCLDSLAATYLPSDALVYIVDDASTEKETIRLIKGFTHSCEIMRVFKKKNTGIMYSLIDAYEYCFSHGYEYAIVVNDDAVLNGYFYEAMTYYKTIFPAHVISGFNTLTPSELGTPRHPIVQREWFYVLKKSSGGLCLGIDREIYQAFFKPSILKKMDVNNRHAYDTASTKAASSEGRFVICTRPSVAEHVGLGYSTMSHDFNPDVSVDFSMAYEPLDAKRVTVNMATFPARRQAFERVIENLLTIKSIDKIRVYLNGYTEVPDVLQNGRIEYVIGEPDIMDTGKFYWAGTHKNEYYFTLDDDFIIDEGYIAKHIELMRLYENRPFVSLHGKVLVEKPANFRDLVAHFDFSADVSENSFSNFLGTGVMVFDNARYKMDLSMFKHHGMTDLYVASYCQANRIPCIVRAHKKTDVQLIYRGPDELWNRREEFAKQHKEILDSVKKWTLLKINIPQ